jgi:hypothetical protein
MPFINENQLRKNETGQASAAVASTKLSFLLSKKMDRREEFPKDLVSA